MSRALFTLQGQVVRGKRLGTRLGFPTANIAYQEQGADWPPGGVYIAIARIENQPKAYAAILNQGRHPTVPEGGPTVEAHLLGYSGGDLYGKRLTLAYQAFLRPEKAFPSLEALKEQLAKDREVALRWANAYLPGLSTPHCVKNNLHKPHPQS